MDTSNSVLHSTPAMIETALLRLLDISEELSDCREAIKDLELEAITDAMDARTEDGSKPLNTNDRQREAHARRWLKEDGQYTQNKNLERELERRKMTMEAAAERLRREYRIALIDYEAQVLGRRVA